MRFAPRRALPIAGAVAAVAVVWGVHAIVARVNDLHAVLRNALSAFRDRDFALRLTPQGDREIADLKRLYNELADTVRADRLELHQKEMLLDVILQRTPVAVILLNAADRVVYSNAAARALLTGGEWLDGRLLDEVAVAGPLREVLDSRGDFLFRFDDETFHLGQRVFYLNTQRHRLLQFDRLTPELRRQERSVWKKAIRVINHEINNSIAPISSLLHSARRAHEDSEHHHRLDEIYGLIDERLTFLRSFLEAYAEFARLPEPRKEKTAWSAVIEPVRLLYEFQIDGSPSLMCNFDRAQMEQVLINLVKNAHESGSAASEIVVSVRRAGEECVFRVLDRGRGMSENVMRQALVPFYSTKPGGSGVGLTLCDEIIDAHGGRMRLQAREGGGTAVTCWIPI